MVCIPSYLIYLEDGGHDPLVFLGVCLHVSFDHISWLCHDSCNASCSQAANKVQLWVKGLIIHPCKGERNKAKLSP